MRKIKFLPQYEHRMIRYNFNNYVQEQDCALNINNAYEKGRADERAKIISIIDWLIDSDYNTKEFQLFKGDFLEQLKEQNDNSNVPKQKTSNV